MKWIALCLMSLTVILAGLYFTLGGMVLIVALSTIVLTTFIVVIFTLGIWYAHKSIRLGARLTLEAISLDDTNDQRQMAALARFGETIYKQTKAQLGDTGYPPLLGDGKAIDGDFSMIGFDEELDQ